MYHPAIDYDVPYSEAVRSAEKYCNTLMWANQVNSQVSEGEIVRSVRTIVEILEFVCNEYFDECRTRSSNNDKTVIADLGETKDLIVGIHNKLSSSSIALSLKKELIAINDLVEYFDELLNDFDLRFNKLPNNKRIAELLATVRNYG